MPTVPSSPYSAPRGSLPSVGITTFAGYPFYRADLTPDLVVVGIPYDEGATGKPGARFGPRAVREASMLYTYEGMEDRFYDADRDRWILQGKRIVDAGDVDIQPLSRVDNWRAIQSVTEDVLARGAVPALIGGDRSVTHAALRAFRDRKVHYVQLASHVDCDFPDRDDHTHGNTVAHILQEDLARSVTVVGVRGLSQNGRGVAWARERGVRIVTASAMRRDGADAWVDQLPDGPVYVGLDIHFFDPAAAPGAGTPEPGGFFFHEFSDIVEALAARHAIVGFDVVEVNPFLDDRGAVTSQLAARCLLELAHGALRDTAAAGPSGS